MKAPWRHTIHHQVARVDLERQNTAVSDEEFAKLLGYGSQVVQAPGGLAFGRRFSEGFVFAKFG